MANEYECQITEFARNRSGYYSTISSWLDRVDEEVKALPDVQNNDEQVEFDNKVMSKLEDLRYYVHQGIIGQNENQEDIVKTCGEG